MTEKKRIAILGATGSIGKSSLDIISRDLDSNGQENFEVVLLAAGSNSSALDELSRQFPSALCIAAGVTGGKEKLLSAINDIHPDITINGISGAAGLEPSLAAINAGSDLALANKETIVMAGQLAKRLASEKNVNIIPVDSEHSAIFHLIKYFAEGSAAETIKYQYSKRNVVNECNENEESNRINHPISEIILTASGGPFKNMSLKEMEKVTVEDALAHPTWKMGPKITIDSASMANKGLEIIEASIFFNIAPEKIKVVIHPQSIVHSMIRLCNGIFYAQLSRPDMRHPIHDALYWPVITPSSLEPLNFDSLSLDFSKPDLKKFPILNFAWTCAKLKNHYTCVFNAANETAVSAFLEQKIKFTDIPKITEHVLDADWTGDHFCLEAILKADNDARKNAMDLIKRGI